MQEEQEAVEEYKSEEENSGSKDESMSSEEESYELTSQAMTDLLFRAQSKVDITLN